MTTKSADITLFQANSNAITAKPPELPSINYLVVLDDESQFVAIKLDEGFMNFARCVGFFTEVKHQKIQGQYKQMIKQMAKENIIEVSIPWSRIKYIESLSYRFRGSK